MALPLRTVHQWLAENLPPPFGRHVLTTTAPIKIELLSALEMYSEIAESGKALLKVNGHRDPNASYSRFRSYMRQGTTFWRAADQLPYRASPLLYYYSFMNLAKAAIFVRDSAFPFGHIHHGLSPGQNERGLRRSVVTIVVPDVFSHLYTHVIWTIPPSRTQFTIPSLLGYLTDIVAEFRMFRLGHVNALPCHYAIASFTQSPAEFCGLVAVPRTGGPEDKMFAKILAGGFSEIVPRDVV